MNINRLQRLLTAIVVIVGLFALADAAVAAAKANHHNGQQLLGEKIKANGSSGVVIRAQGSVTFTFGDRDRQAMREWYRDHYNAREFQGQQRWNDQSEQRLQVGIVLAPDLRAWARPAPQDLYGRLAPLPGGLSIRDCRGSCRCIGRPLGDPRRKPFRALRGSRSTSGARLVPRPS